MKNLILIDDENDYTLSEFTHLVRRVLSAVANESPDMEFVYPEREVYFAIFDLLGYINDRVTGEFRITQTKSKHYQVLYVPEKAARKEADKPMMRSRAATAKLLKRSLADAQIGLMVMITRRTHGPPVVARTTMAKKSRTYPLHRSHGAR